LQKSVKYDFGPQEKKKYSYFSVLKQTYKTFLFCFGHYVWDSGPWSNIVKFRPLLQPIKLQKTLGFRPLLIYKKISFNFLRSGIHALISALYLHFSVLSPFQRFIPISAFYHHDFSVLSPFQVPLSVSVSAIQFQRFIPTPIQETSFELLKASRLVLYIVFSLTFPCVIRRRMHWRHLV
jgi:hypothetical protein